MSSTQTKSNFSSAGSEASPSPIPSHMLRRHPASLVPRHFHDSILLGLLKAPVNDELVEYVGECTLAVVASPGDTAQLPTPPTTPVKSNFRRTISRTLKQSPVKDAPEQTESSNSSSVPSLTTFIKLTAARANAQAPTLLVTLVYLDRLRQRLRGAKAAKGMQCTYHRLFLACLIAAAKYCNDCCPRNAHWAKWSGLFTLSEVNLMEQELLMLLDYELRVEEKSLLLMCTPFLPPCTADKVTAMDRKAPSATSCGTTRTSSSDSQDDVSTPPSSPVAVRLNASQDTSPTCCLDKKKVKLTDATTNSSVAVLTRAKSWYGSIRAAAALGGPPH